jgi:DNA adenine methylase
MTGLSGEPPLKPYLKWAGGKRQLLPELRKILLPWTASHRYFEPFAGAGAVFLDLRPPRAVINDINTQLMLSYRVIKDDVETLIALLREHQQKNCEAYYYRVRNMDRDTESFEALGNVEKAARLIYLNKSCYNGLFRVNSRGFFNVPWGKREKVSLCDEASLRRISAYLNTGAVTLLNTGFEEALPGADSASIVYFDPPYHTEGRNFTSYQAGGFDAAAQERLRDLFTRLTSLGVKCLLSNSDTAFIRALYRDFRAFTITVGAKRIINADSSGRGPVNEVLIRNWRD